MKRALELKAEVIRAMAYEAYCTGAISCDEYLDALAEACRYESEAENAE